MDSGIDIGAPEFGGRAENFKGLKMNQESPYAPQGRVSEKEGMDDFNGHGTFVAGIAGANDFGVAPEASLYNVKVGLRTGIYSLTGRVKAFNDIIEAHTESMRTSLDNYGYRGAIINMSWGIFTHYETVVIGRALTRCAEAGIFLVAAAGNSNVQVALYPCTHHNVHCVGSINAFYEKAPMSNWGRRVIWWAPGDDVVSILPRRKRAPDPQGNIINYAVASGTSFAAPHFAGVASIILAWRGFMPWIEVGKIAIDNALRDVLVNFKNTNFLVNTGILNPKKDDREPFMYAGWKYADVRNGDRFFPERISTTPKVRSSAQSHRVHSAPGNQPSHAVILPPRGQPPAGAATFEPTSSAGGRPPSTEARSESTLSRTPLQRRLPPPGTSDAGSTITLSNTFFTNTASLTTWTSSISYWTSLSGSGTKSTASKTKSTASETRSTETDDPDCDPEETEL